jgi:hypothetical protein
MTTEDKSTFITVYKPIAGWKAVMMSWNEDGFWEPWQTGMFAFKTKAEAEVDAQMWAEAEELRYVPYGEEKNCTKCGKTIESNEDTCVACYIKEAVPCPRCKGTFKELVDGVCVACNLKEWEAEAEDMSNEACAEDSPIYDDDIPF